MKTSTISSVLRRLNTSKFQDSIFLRPIGGNSYVASVWIQRPHLNDRLDRPSSDRFFFITDESGVFVAAVYDMIHDLHWYVLPKYRGLGHLTNGLKEAILPFIFNQNRDVQTITIDSSFLSYKNYLKSKKVALALGFKQVNGDLFQLSKNMFDFSYSKFHETFSSIEEERIKDLQKRVNFATKMLYQVADEINIVTGHDELIHEVNDMHRLVWTLENYIDYG